MTETKKPAEKEERNKIRGSRDKQSAPMLFPEGLVRGLHPDDASGINSSATGLEKPKCRKKDFNRFERVG